MQPGAEFHRVVDRGDVGVPQARGDVDLSLEAAALLLGGEPAAGEHFERHDAAGSLLHRLVHHALAARADRRNDPIARHALCRAVSQSGVPRLDGHQQIRQKLVVGAELCELGCALGARFDVPAQIG